MDKLEYLKLLLVITDTSEDTLLDELLTLATNIALNTKYPFGGETTLPSELDFWVILAAKELYDKKNTLSGVSSYRENGISISLESAMGEISYGLLGAIVPKARTPQ